MSGFAQLLFAAALMFGVGALAWTMVLNAQSRVYESKAMLALANATSHTMIVSSMFPYFVFGIVALIAVLSIVVLVWALTRPRGAYQATITTRTGQTMTIESQDYKRLLSDLSANDIQSPEIYYSVIRR